MARVYRVPEFNLLCFAFSPGQLPGVDVPKMFDVPCQLYLHSKADIDVTQGNFNAWVPPIYLRFPRTYTDIKRDWICKIDGYFELYYKVRWAEHMHLGFPNQYWQAQCEQCTVEGESPLPVVP